MPTARTQSGYPLSPSALPSQALDSYAETAATAVGRALSGVQRCLPWAFPQCQLHSSEATLTLPTTEADTFIPECMGRKKTALTDSLAPHCGYHVIV